PRLAMANSADGFTPALIAGFGPAAQPESIVWRELLDGALVEVMPDWRMATIDLSWMTPTGSVRRTRVFEGLEVAPGIVRHLPVMDRQGW
ncbi:MAG: hypothetical protein ABSD80_16965, partial [Caulobacteraceae bacterium]